MSFHNVKLESSSTKYQTAPPAPRGARSNPSLGGRNLLAGARRRPPLPSCRGHSGRGRACRPGLARTLSPAWRQNRHLTARYDGSRGARHGITTGLEGPSGSPVPGCLAHSFPRIWCCIGLTSPATFSTPLSCRSGSSFPADSAKPVPLAVVSLDSR